MKVSNVIAQLRTTDLKSTIQFYTSRLGFELDFEFNDFYAGIKVAESQLIHLKLVDEKDPSIDYVRNNGHFHLFLVVDDAESTADTLRANDVTFHSNIENTAWGTKEFYILDDQGHVLCFAQSIGL